MVANEEYDILTEGGLFCKCRHTEDGDIRLIGKNTDISLMELQQKALNPALAKKDRGKRPTPKRYKTASGF